MFGAPPPHKHPIVADVSENGSSQRHRRAAARHARGIGKARAHA